MLPRDTASLFDPEFCRPDVKITQERSSFESQSHTNVKITQKHSSLELQSHLDDNTQDPVAVEPLLQNSDKKADLVPAASPLGNKTSEPVHLKPPLTDNGKVIVRAEMPLCEDNTQDPVSFDDPFEDSAYMGPLQLRDDYFG